MTPRKPNMLEAFQRSAQADEAKRQGAREAENALAGTPAANEAQSKAPSSKTMESAAVGGPFAQAEEPAENRSEVRSVAPSAAPRRRPTPPLQPLRSAEDVLGTEPRSARRDSPRLPLIVAAVVVAMIATFLIGRDFGQSGSVQADEGGANSDADLIENFGKDTNNQPTNTGESHANSNQPAPAAAAQLTDDDRAFLNKNNNWTVIAISFDANTAGGELALKTYRYLREQGLPAVAPITQGKYLSICVGAEPSRNSGIENIRAQLQRLAGPPPQNERAPFSSAYFANIDDLIDPSLRH